MPRVLVVDDHPDTAETLAVVLALNGHGVRAVTSGLAAFHLLPEFTPDVCLLDIRMPGMDGFELATRLRECLGPAVRLLAVTGELRAVADPRAGVFERVFPKPLGLDELLQALVTPTARSTSVPRESGNVYLPDRQPRQMPDG